MITLYELSLVTFFFSFRFFKRNDWNFEFDGKTIFFTFGLVLGGTIVITGTIGFIINYLP